jgi:hypothetical protein
VVGGGGGGGGEAIAQWFVCGRRVWGVGVRAVVFSCCQRGKGSPRTWVCGGRVCDGHPPPIQVHHLLREPQQGTLQGDGNGAPQVVTLSNEQGAGQGVNDEHHIRGGGVNVLVALVRVPLWAWCKTGVGEGMRERGGGGGGGEGGGGVGDGGGGGGMGGVPGRGQPAITHVAQGARGAQGRTYKNVPVAGATGHCHLQLVGLVVQATLPTAVVAML